MRILGIETSCDETAVALYDGDRGLVAHELYSQIPLHAQYGGVVPELASRDHIRKLLPLIDQCLSSANLSASDVDGIAYTKGPGLIGALMVGASVARSLGWAWNVPTLGVHHMEAHLMAVMLEDNPPECPFIALLVSGGHTMLVRVTGLGEYTLLGQTIDDAAGEAFDKTAKLLGLPYPGGPVLAKLAEQGDGARFDFPRPMTNRPGLDFSFSGLKTFTRNCFACEADDEQTKADIACAFEDAVVDTLVLKAKRALKENHLNKLVVVGGVGANKKLRARMKTLMHDLHGEVFYPRIEFCTDNGAMVAYTGWLRMQRGEHDSLSFDVSARLVL